MDGQRAVAHVLANRVKSGRWGASLGEVCLSEYRGVYQFSGWARNDPNRIAAMRLRDNDPVLVALAGLVYAAVNGEVDPTGGATHYYAPKIIACPIWVAGDPAKGVKPALACGQHGTQLFFKNVA